MAYKVLFHPVLDAEEKNTFLELIRTYTIRDYSLYPHTMSAYGEALPGWPGSDNIHKEHSTHLAEQRNGVQTDTHTDACTSSEVCYEMRHCKPLESD